VADAQTGRLQVFDSAGSFVVALPINYPGNSVQKAEGAVGQIRFAGDTKFVFDMGPVLVI